MSNFKFGTIMTVVFSAAAAYSTLTVVSAEYFRSGFDSDKAHVCVNRNFPSSKWEIWTVQGSKLDYKLTQAARASLSGKANAAIYINKETMKQLSDLIDDKKDMNKCGPKIANSLIAKYRYSDERNNRNIWTYSSLGQLKVAMK